MGSTVLNVAFDSLDAFALASWWSRVVEHPVDPEDGPEEDEASIELPGGPTLHFNTVPEPKTAKNRLHLCLSPDSTRDQEVERVLALGATLVSDLRRPEGPGWVVLADPEGNEFCILRNAAERAATS